MKHAAILFVSALVFAVIPGHCIATEAPDHTSAAENIRLNNDAKYKDALDKLLQSPPPKSAALEAQLDYLYDLLHAALNLRDYSKAIACGRQLSKLDPDSWASHDSLSVCLGKAGKYDEAITEAQQAIALDKPRAMHSNLVLASWELLNGKKEAALKRIASVVVPADERMQRSYYGSLSAFYAALGDEEKLQDAITKTRALDKQGTFMDFLARDICFDPYRGKDWFIKIVGKTLAEPASGK